MTNKMLFC